MAVSRPSAATAAAVAAASGLAACLVAGLLVPIYTDEVTWRMQLSRSPIDGGFDRGLGDQCGANAVIAAPWFMQPMRHLSAWVNLALPDPAWVRIGGVASALGWLWLVWRLAARLGDGARRPATAIVFALAGLGVLPLLLVWSRPEQPLLLCYTTALLIALRRREGSATRDAVAAGAIVLLGIITLGYHPKAVVFLPLLLAAVALSSKGASGRYARIGAIAILIACAAIAFRYWTTRLACPGDPILAAKLAAENVGAAVRGRPFGDTVMLLARNAPPWGYVSAVLPSPNYMSDWLPQASVPALLGVSWQSGVRVVWGLAVCLAGALTVARLAHDLPRRRLRRETVLAVAILFTVLAWGATQYRKNSYEAALTLPLLAIALVLVVPWRDARARRIAGRFAAAAAGCALISEALLLAIYVPPLARLAARPGPIAGQVYSFVPWHNAALETEIAAAMRACAIDPARAHDVLVDDITYFPMMTSVRPQHRMALMGPWTGSVRDVEAYLAARHSSGVLVACASAPPGLRTRMRVVGRFCCMGAM